MRKLPKRIALARAVTTACLAIGLAHAQTAAPDARHGSAEVRGRMLDRSAADLRAVEIGGSDVIPRSAERELPKAVFVLGDERTLQGGTPASTTAAQSTPRSDSSTPRFDSGADLLRPADRERLDPIVAQVRGRSGLRFEIVGHTDVQRISPALQARFPDNQALGLARA